MKVKTKSEKSGWTLLQREYASRCKKEIELTNLVLKWWDEETEKSLDKLEAVLDKNRRESLAGGRIIQLRNARGKYTSPPHYREYEISLTKPNRAPFIVVGEPFKQ